MLPPAEQPLQYLAFLPYLERHQQPVLRFLFANHVIRARFLYPACYFRIEQHTYHCLASAALLVFAHLEIDRALKRSRKQLQVVDAVKTKVTDVLAEMTVRDHVPAPGKMYQAIRISLAAILLAFTIPAMTRMIVEAYSGMLDNGAAQLL